MRQWFLRMTAYADELIDGLDALDWPQWAKQTQRDWIGRSHGVEVTFRLDDDTTIPTFTTRVDTLFGVTFLAVSPTHELVSRFSRVTAVAAVVSNAATTSGTTRRFQTTTDGAFTGVHARHRVRRGERHRRRITVRPGRTHVEEIANKLLTQHGKTDDDALVFAIRFLG
jgi:leucyl-tRNA synthetase